MFARKYGGRGVFNGVFFVKILAFTAFFSDFLNPDRISFVLKNSLFWLFWLFCLCLVKFLKFGTVLFCFVCRGVFRFLTMIIPFCGTPNKPCVISAVF